MQLYNIVRFYFERNTEEKIIDWGFTLEEAQEHCQRDDTEGATWFDAYRKAEPCINKRAHLTHKRRKENKKEHSKEQ